MELENDQWNKENISKLIELYRESVELWDTRSPLFKLKNKKHDAWMRISEVMNIEKTEVEKKMRCLIGQFQREEKKCKSLQKSGAGSDEIYTSKWFALKLLMFLKDKNKPRETIEAGIVNEKDGETEESDAPSNEIEEENVRDGFTGAGLESISQEKAALKKRSTRVTTSNKRSEEAYAVLKSLQQNINTRDEYDAFGEVVAAKLRKLDEYARDDTMLQIDHLLLKAKQGRFQYQHNVPLSIHLPQNQFSASTHVFPNPSTSNSSSIAEYPFSSPSSLKSVSSIPNQFSQPPSPFNETQPSLSQLTTSSSFAETQPNQSSNSELLNTVKNYFQTFNDVNEY